MSPPIAAGYAGPVGATSYSAPETFCDLAGNRDIAKYTDVYALGCLLFELFNPGAFYFQVQSNPNYMPVLAALAVRLQLSPPQKRVDIWRREISQLARGITNVPIDGPGNTAPPSVAQLLQELLNDLTQFDFNRRESDLEAIHRRTRSAIKVLANEDAYQERLQRKRSLRVQRSEKIRRRDERLAQFLAGKKALSC